jgi:hypothetical protein
MWYSQAIGNEERKRDQFCSGTKSIILWNKKCEDKGIMVIDKCILLLNLFIDAKIKNEQDEQVINWYCFKGWMIVPCVGCRIKDLILEYWRTYIGEQ